MDETTIQHRFIQRVQFFLDMNKPMIKLPMIRKASLALLLLSLPAGSSAQLALPSLGPPLGGVLDRAGGLLGSTLDQTGGVIRSATALAETRLARIAEFVSRNGATVELDLLHQPARRGELVLIDPDAESLARANGVGFHVIEQGQIDGLDLPYARLAVPEGRSLARAQKELSILLPGKEVTADQISFPSGAAIPAAAFQQTQSLVSLPRGGTVGVIDGGVPAGGRVVAQAGFASGAPRPNSHAQAIRSLLSGAGDEKIYAADVYGSDPAGGNALAIARAMGWMVQNHVPVVSISLVGPANPLLDRAVSTARGRGVVVVAAVGNDGPSAPPQFPASYPGVIAVTGVDKRGRVLFEAGRAAHLDYAAPGADITTVGLDGKRIAVRGTSFAAPLAAARIAANRARSTGIAAALSQTNSEAQGGSTRTGHGILCDTCRTGM